ncbi:hypothetical protein GCM10010425_05350 [Streptomyces spororaveus]|uniref:Uncharacterized protein n=1 Tax=Streptomyces spororaveus TaxID=284039 RepID=A0ABQ3TFD8_9ACTN|nr:hypothetical protein Sspor_46960 [Streptomyces spororaveus]
MQSSYRSIKRPAGVEHDPRRPPRPAAAAKDDGPCRAVPGGQLASPTTEYVPEAPAEPAQSIAKTYCFQLFPAKF